MTEQEYNEKIKIAEKNYKGSLNEIYKQYAFDLRKFKIGDIIKNNGTTIIIESFSAYKRQGFPEPVYSGKELTKKLEPRKDGNIGSIYGNYNVELIKDATS